MSTDKQHFPCQKCGAQLSYQPGTKHMACAHCGHRHQISVNNRGIEEIDFYSAVDQLTLAKSTIVSKTVKCDNCAAEFEFEKNIHADDCPYCGSKIVSDAHELRHIKPWGVLPFKIDSQHASHAYSKWLKKLWFAPGKLKRYARKDQKLNGMYVPYWTYDSRTKTQYVGKRGTFYHVPMQVRVKVNDRWTTQTQMVTKIRWNRVSGHVSRHFDDVLIFASNSLPRAMARELAPWDLENLVQYDDQYLSGFRSEMYQIDLKEGFNIARERMHPVIQSDIHTDIGGDQQQILSSNTEYSDIGFKHILLPFWTAGFRFGKKSYQFIVNARTGEVQGERPYSKWKIFLCSIAIALILLILFGLFTSSSNFHASGSISILEELFYNLYRLQ